jgi:glycosyltransferase involved in cell wall biosynthesis
MRLAVVSNKVPFLRGGADELLDALVEELRRRDHEVEPIQLVFSSSPPQRVLDHMLVARLTRLRGIDRVIALKFPAYFIPHHDKVLWLLHQFRQAYDLWGGPFQDLPSAPEGEMVRAAVIAADNRLLPEAERIYVNSEVTQQRLWRYNGIASEVLRPPLIRPQTYEVGSPTDYILSIGRIKAGKRQHLLVEAMKHVRSPVRLIIAGAPEMAADGERLRARVTELGLEDRVELILRSISHDEKVELLAGSVAAAYLPVDEDSYGYATLEALYVQRPVITCNDSGGTLALVKEDVTGIVSDPDPRALAVAIDALGSDAVRARRMGAAGRKLLDALGINWDHVVECLTR